MTAMDYRQYDNALGRFNSMDALSERAYDISPYRFALNNPNFWMDPSGLFETRKEAREYKREHGIKGRVTKQNDGSFALNDKKNGVSYSAGDDTNSNVDQNIGDGVVETFFVSNEKNNESNFVSNGKTINDYFGLATSPLEAFRGPTFRLSTSKEIFSPKIYSSGWNGNQYVKTASVFKAIGWVGFGIGTALDYKGVKNYNNPKIGPNSPNSVHPNKAKLNAGVGLYGLLINPIPSIFYSGIDTFYPGGWDGAMKDTAVRQAEFDRVVNKNSGMAPQYIFPYGSQKF